MTGLLLLFLAALWLVIAYWLVKLVTTKVPPKWWRIPLRVVLILVLVPLPVIDEIVGQRQFEQLCRENSTIKIDRAKAAGKTVYLADSSPVEVKGTWVRVVLKPWRFVDATTQETIVSYNTLHATGGWFVHALPLSEGRVPLMFRGSCVPANRPASAKTFGELGITYIERPANKGT